MSRFGNLLTASSLVIVLAIFQSCIPDSIELDDSMILETYKMSIKEPSGLSFSADGKSLYTVSDQGRLYHITFTGKVISQLPYTDEDFEGVTVNASNSNIYVVKERTGELVELNSKGNVISTFNVIGNSGNSGLEGVTFDSKRNVFYLLKEKTPGLLITYSLEKGIISQKRLTFANDYSGIFYNESTGNLWIISQESRTVSKCNLSGEALESFKLPIFSIEGIIVNDNESEAYIVSDNDNSLYKIKF